MSAVLCDAVVCYLDHAAATTRERRRLRDDAARWIASGDTAWPFSYENICTKLGLKAHALRRTVWKLRSRPAGRARRCVLRVIRKQAAEELQRDAA